MKIEMVELQITRPGRVELEDTLSGTFYAFPVKKKVMKNKPNKFNWFQCCLVFRHTCIVEF